MTAHNRPGYHQSDWDKADRLGARIRWIERGLFALGFATGWAMADYFGWFK